MVSQIKPYLPYMKLLIVLGKIGKGVDRLSQLEKEKNLYGLGDKVTFIPMELGGKWRETLLEVACIQSCLQNKFTRKFFVERCLL